MARTAADTPAPGAERLRVDKWLWAARFFKTRSLAADAVEGGKVHVNGTRVKPARDVRVGDTLDITREGLTWRVEVLALSDRRGPAPVAQTLYRETAESQAARLAAQELRRLTAGLGDGHGRPTKRDRRQLDQWQKGDG